jgi:hypothetical protein
MANNLDELFTDEDRNELEQIQKMRKNILKNIGIANFIDLIRNLIDDSEHYEFTSAAKRKFISINTPIFTIRKKDFVYNEKDYRTQGNKDDKINEITKEITKEILDKTTTAILNIINSDEELKKIYGDINETLRGLMWTTVFEIRVSLQDNIIYMRYCI